MSSILDALNKLEEDKAKAQQENQQDIIDPETAAKDFVGPDVMRDQVTVKVSPMMVAVGGVCTIILISVFAVGGTLFVLGMGDRADSDTSSIQLLAETVPVVELASTRVETPTESVRTSVDTPPEKIVLPDPVAPDIPKKEIPQEDVHIAKVQEEIPAKPVPQKKEKEIIVPEVIQPETVLPKEIITTAAIPTVESNAPPQPRRVPQVNLREIRRNQLRNSQNPKREVEVIQEPIEDEVNIRQLPVFSRALQNKYELDKLRINMVSPASETNPSPSARINMDKYYIGDSIKQSSVRLFQVESFGVGLEISRTGEQYFLKF